jgi:hypothetical protein
MPPTLLIGIGGTGTKIIGEVKKTLQERNKLQGAHLRFLAVDCTGKAEHNKISANELAYYGSIDHQNALRDDKKATGFNTWFPKQYEIAPSVSYAKGCGMIRLNGKYYMYRKGQHILNRLGTELAALNPANLGGGWASITVIICAVLSNGTGAGMALDMAYAVRHKISQLGLGAYQLIGAFLCGSIPLMKKTDDAALRVAGNAYAFTKEVYWWSKVAPKRNVGYAFKLSDGTEIESALPPFDQVFLIQQRNKKGGRLGDIMDYVRLAGLSLSNSVLDPNVGNRMLDNAVTFAPRSGQFLGSVGFASLRLPVEDLASYIVSKASEEAITVLLQRRNAQAVTSPVATTVDQWGEKIEKEWKRVSTPVESMRVTLGSLQRKDRNQVNAIANSQEKKVDDAATSAENEFQKELNAVFSPDPELAVRTRVLALLEAGSFADCKHYVEFVVHDLEEIAEKAKSKSKTHQTEPSTSIRTDILRDLENELTSIWKLWRHPEQSADAFVSAYLSKKLEARKWRMWRLVEEKYRTLARRIRERYLEVVLRRLEETLESQKRKSATNRAQKERDLGSLNISEQTISIYCPVFGERLEDIQKDVLEIEDIRMAIAKKAKDCLEDFFEERCEEREIGDAINVGAEQIFANQRKNAISGIHTKNYTIQKGILWIVEDLLTKLIDALRHGDPKTIQRVCNKMCEVIAESDVENIKGNIDQELQKNPQVRNEALIEKNKNVAASSIVLTLSEHANTWWQPEDGVTIQGQTYVSFDPAQTALSQWLVTAGGLKITQNAGTPPDRIEFVKAEGPVSPEQLQITNMVLEKSYEKVKKIKHLWEQCPLHVDRRFEDRWQFPIGEPSEGLKRKVDQVLWFAIDQGIIEVKDKAQFQDFQLVQEIGRGANLHSPVEDLGATYYEVLDRLYRDDSLRDALGEKYLEFGRKIIRAKDGRGEFGGHSAACGYTEHLKSVVEKWHNKGIPYVPDNDPLDLTGPMARLQEVVDQKVEDKNIKNVAKWNDWKAIVEGGNESN